MDQKDFDQRILNSRAFSELAAELAHHQAESLAIVMSAVMDQLDPAKLAQSLREVIAAHQKTGTGKAMLSPALAVLAAADAAQRARQGGQPTSH